MKDFVVSGEESEIQITLFDLVVNLQKVLDRAKAKHLLEIERDEMTVSQVIEKLRFLFEQSPGAIKLSEILSAYRGKRSMIVAFLAILEMVYFHAITLIQKQTFGDVTVRRRDNFEKVMTNLDQWMSGEKLTLKATV